MNSARNAEDISRFIDDELDKKIRKHDLLAGDVDADLRAIIKNRTFERSNGMFRYASMQIDRLCNDSMDRLTVLDELEKPLPGITSLYEQSVTEIQNERIDRVRMTAQTALRWLMCVQEELPMSAFLEAVCVEVSVSYLEKLLTPLLLLSLLSFRGMITLVQDNILMEIKRCWS